jgi:transposase
MATPRQFGQELDQNVRRRRNISPATRDRCIGMLQGGMTVQEVAVAIQRSERAIRDLRLKYRQTGSVQDKPRSGRPPVLSKQQKKIIYRKVRAAPKIEYSQLAKEAIFVNAEGTPSKPPSRSTLYRALKRRGLTNYKAEKRPKFTRAHALLRLKFAHKYRHFAWVRRTLKFSDECSVQKGSGANQEWCFRYPWEKWKPDILDPTSTSRKPAQMVWACVWLDKRGRARRSKLVIMERDPDAKKRGYSAQSYMKALTQGLLPHWRRSELFMQDNAGIHRSKAVAAFHREHHINCIEWPAYSPDLNPIEHLWWVLKRRMYKLYPQYNNFGQAQEEWDGFCEALKECWRGIPTKLIKRLIMSMPRRLAAVRKARGWQTRH